MRKRYMIIVVGIVSALLGGIVGGYSLAANVQGRPVEKYHESMRISVFNCGSSGALDSGVHFDSTNKFLFTLNSKGTSMKVTDLWISFTYYSSSSGNLFIYINGNMAASWINFWMCGSSRPARQTTVHVTNATIYDLIVFGINSIELETNQGSMLLQALDIFIEYEYQAT